VCNYKNNSMNLALNVQQNSYRKSIWICSYWTVGLGWYFEHRFVYFPLWTLWWCMGSQLVLKCTHELWLYDSCSNNIMVPIILELLDSEFYATPSIAICNAVFTRTTYLTVTTFYKSNKIVIYFTFLHVLNLTGTCEHSRLSTLKVSSTLYIHSFPSQFLLLK